MSRGTERLIFIAAVAVTMFLVAFFIVPRSVWFSRTGMLLTGGILAVAVLASLVERPEAAPPQTLKAIREGLTPAALARAVAKQALFWICVLLVIALVFYVARAMSAPNFRWSGP
jgi:hypothetical protein